MLRYCRFWAQIRLLVGDIAAHFSGAVRFTVRMGEHCAAISQDLAPNPGTNPTKRSTQLPEGRSGRLNREGADKQCETGPAHTGTQLHFSVMTTETIAKVRPIVTGQRDRIFTDLKEITSFNSVQGQMIPQSSLS